MNFLFRLPFFGLVFAEWDAKQTPMGFSMERILGEYMFFMHKMTVIVTPRKVERDVESEAKCNQERDGRCLSNPD